MKLTFACLSAIFPKWEWGDLWGIPPPHASESSETEAAGVSGVMASSSYRYYFLGEVGPVQINVGWGEISFRDRIA